MDGVVDQGSGPAKPCLGLAVDALKGEDIPQPLGDAYARREVVVRHCPAGHAVVAGGGVERVLGTRELSRRQGVRQCLGSPTGRVQVIGQLED